MASWRCSMCGINWPRLADFTSCPQCEAKCDGMTAEPTITEPAAQSLRKHCEFERYYAERERQHQHVQSEAA